MCDADPLDVDYVDFGLDLPAGGGGDWMMMRSAPPVVAGGQAGVGEAAQPPPHPPPARRGAAHDGIAGRAGRDDRGVLGGVQR